jgi:putative oxidoreductase
MPNGRMWLCAAAWFTAVAALLHLAVIAGGPDWYRFFGAGERTARLAARGAASPAVLSAAIAGVLGVWALYGLSGAGVVRRLPALRPALLTIAAIYIARGLLAVPFVLLAPGPYAAELRGRMAFLIVTSLICLALGACYAGGAAAVESPPRPPGARTLGSSGEVS